MLLIIGLRGRGILSVVDVDVDEVLYVNLIARNQKRRLMMRRCWPAIVPGG